MLANSLAAFLKLCAKDRAEIAMALWESLTDAEREAEVPTPEVSLSGVPKDAADGELFFVLSSDGTWTVEYARKLQLEKLQRSE